MIDESLSKIVNFEKDIKRLNQQNEEEEKTLKLI